MRLDLTNWMSGLKVPNGPRAGEYFEVLPWQERFFQMMEREPGDLVLSMARGNGKTAIAAAVATACVHPEGPLHVRGAETVIVASSVRQAGAVYGDVLAMLFPEGRPKRNDETWRVRDSDRLRRVDHRPSRASVEVIGSSPRRAMGLRPLLVLVDEPASWPRGSGDRLMAALRTSLGKQPGSRLVVLGTRSDDPEHWFERMLAESSSLIFASDPSADVTDPETWAPANPSLDHMESLRERIAYEAAQAKTSPSLLSNFRALRLNAAPEAHLVKWKLIEPEERRTVECSPDALPDREGKPIWGVELGGSATSSAIAAMWRTGRLEAFAAFPSRPNLSQRGRDDHVDDAYMRMSDEGSLIVVGGDVMDYAAVIREGLARYGRPGSIMCEHRSGWLGDALAAAGLEGVPINEEGEIRDSHLIYFKTELRKEEGGIRCAPSLLLRAATSEVRMNRKSWKLVKGKLVKGKLIRPAWDEAAVAIIRAGSALHWQRRMELLRNYRR